MIYGLKNPAEANHVPNLHTVKHEPHADTITGTTLESKTIHHSGEAIHHPPTAQQTHDSFHQIPAHLHPFSHDPATWSIYHDIWNDSSSGHYHDPNYLDKHQEYERNLNVLEHHNEHDPYGQYHLHDHYMKDNYSPHQLHSNTLHHQEAGVITTAALGPHVTSLPTSGGHTVSHNVQASNIAVMPATNGAINSNVAHGIQPETANLPNASVQASQNPVNTSNQPIGSSLPVNNSNQPIGSSFPANTSNQPSYPVNNSDQPISLAHPVNAESMQSSISPSSPIKSTTTSAHENPKNDIVFDPLPGVLPAVTVSRVIKDRTLDITVHGDPVNRNRGKIFIFQRPQ